MKLTFVSEIKIDTNMSLLSFLGLDNKSGSIAEYQQKGAIILDVRTKGEFASGHIKGSKNIPLNELPSKIEEIKKWNKPVIACCQSGMRSSQATQFLQKNGIDVVNGGGWHNVEMNLKSS